MRPSTVNPPLWRDGDARHPSIVQHNTIEANHYPSHSPAASGRGRPDRHGDRNSLATGPDATRLTIVHGLAVSAEPKSRSRVIDRPLALESSWHGRRPASANQDVPILLTKLSNIYKIVQ